MDNSKPIKLIFIIPVICLILSVVFAADTAAAWLACGSKGATVRRLQQDLAYLGYFSGLPTGYFGVKTRDAVKAFQRANGLRVDGIAGSSTLAMISRRVREKGANLSSRRNETIGLIPWSEVNPIWPRGTTAKIWDVETRKCLTVWRLQGGFHADVEPLTRQDTATLLEICGGRWTSERKAVLVELHGRLIAASIYPYPHGNERIRNNGFKGQFCVHFLGSRVHKSGRVDPRHQEAIFRAAQACPTWFQEIYPAENGSPDEQAPPVMADNTEKIPAQETEDAGDIPSAFQVDNLPEAKR